MPRLVGMWVFWTEWRVWGGQLSALAADPGPVYWAKVSVDMERRCGRIQA